MAKKRTIRTIPRERTPMREQPAAERVKNFAEVACGFSQEDALRESERCLLCPEQPCVDGCPVGIDITAEAAAIRAAPGKVADGNV